MHNIHIKGNKNIVIKDIDNSTITLNQDGSDNIELIKNLNTDLLNDVLNKVNQNNQYNLNTIKDLIVNELERRNDIMKGDSILGDKIINSYFLLNTGSSYVSTFKSYFTILVSVLGLKFKSDLLFKENNPQSISIIVYALCSYLLGVFVLFILSGIDKSEINLTSIFYQLSFSLVIWFIGSLAFHVVAQIFTVNRISYSVSSGIAFLIFSTNYLVSHIIVLILSPFRDTLNKVFNITDSKIGVDYYFYFIVQILTLTVYVSFYFNRHTNQKSLLAKGMLSFSILICALIIVLINFIIWSINKGLLGAGG